MQNTKIKNRVTWERQLKNEFRAVKSSSQEIAALMQTVKELEARGNGSETISFVIRATYFGGEL